MDIPQEKLFSAWPGGFGRHCAPSGCGAVSQGCHPGGDSVETVAAQSVDAT